MSFVSLKRDYSFNEVAFLQLLFMDGMTNNQESEKGLGNWERGGRGVDMMCPSHTERQSHASYGTKTTEDDNIYSR
jgi:hypothetical protein